MKKTQKERILDYLKTHKEITGLDCALILRIVEYRHPIMELRREGYNITGEWKSTENGTRYVLYKLVEK